MWDEHPGCNIYSPLESSASSLGQAATLDPGSGSDTICNAPRIPLEDIVRFGADQHIMASPRTVFSWHGKEPEAQSRPKGLFDGKVSTSPYEEGFVRPPNRCGMNIQDVTSTPLGELRTGSGGVTNGIRARSRIECGSLSQRGR